MSEAEAISGRGVCERCQAPPRRDQGPILPGSYCAIAFLMKPMIIMRIALPTNSQTRRVSLNDMKSDPEVASNLYYLRLTEPFMYSAIAFE